MTILDPDWDEAINITKKPLLGIPSTLIQICEDYCNYVSIFLKKKGFCENAWKMLTYWKFKEASLGQCRMNSFYWGKSSRSIYLLVNNPVLSLWLIMNWLSTIQLNETRYVNIAKKLAYKPKYRQWIIQ